MDNETNHRYVTYEEVEDYCSSCMALERRNSTKDGRPYYYCNQFYKPVFLCIDECKELDRDMKEHALQTTIDTFFHD